VNYSYSGISFLANWHLHHFYIIILIINYTFNNSSVLSLINNQKWMVPMKRLALS